MPTTEYKRVKHAQRDTEANAIANVKTREQRLAADTKRWISKLEDGTQILEGGYVTRHIERFSTLAAALTAFSSTDTHAILGKSITLTANATIPSNVALEVLKGATINRNGFTLTIDGPFLAGPHTVFTGTGTTVFGKGSTNVFNVKWWGATGDGTTDDTDALDAAITAVGTNGGKLLVPKPASSYLISAGDSGIGVGTVDATTPIHILGEGSKIKQAVTTDPYDMFRFRSNMTIENIILEGYIASGTSEGNVVPANSYGFRTKHSGAGTAANVRFINCLAYDCSFAGYYADPGTDGNIKFINCSGYNGFRNDLAVTRATYVEVDGGEWGNDTRSIAGKNAAIDIEPEPAFTIGKAIVKNLDCFHKVSLSGDAGIGYFGWVDNITFDGTVYAEACGMSFGHFSSVRLGNIRHINGAQYIYVNAKWYENGLVLKGRFYTDDRSQSQIANLIPIECTKAAGWTATGTSGSPTLTEGVTIAGRKGIRLENSGGGYNYLRKNIAVNPGRYYSFGCLINAATIDTHKTGLIVKMNHATLPWVSTNGPVSTDEVERICGAVYIPSGTTSVDLLIGSDSSTDAYDITFADIYFCEGIVDNESAAMMFEDLKAWMGTHYFTNLVQIASSDPELRLTDTDTGDEYKILNAGGIFAIMNHTDGRTELSISGSGGVTIGESLSVTGTGALSSTYGLSLGGVGLSNGIIRSHESLYMNIDSNNDDTGTLFAWGHNAATTGHTRLASLWDSGNMRIGSTNTDPGVTLQVDGDTTVTGLLLARASVAGGASARLPHGTAPSAPVDGDMWTTTAGLFVRINGATVGPLS